MEDHGRLLPEHCQAVVRLYVVCDVRYTALMSRRRNLGKSAVFVVMGQNQNLFFECDFDEISQYSCSRNILCIDDNSNTALSTSTHLL